MPLRKIRYSASAGEIDFPRPLKRFLTHRHRVPCSGWVNSTTWAAFFSALIAAVRPSGSSPAENVNTENDYLVGEVASDGQLCIGLNNEAQYTMFQMDVALPEGAVLVGVEGTDRMKASHTIEWCKQEGKVWRILVGTTSLATFRGNAGDLLTLEVNGMDEGFATIENCLFVTLENILKRMADLTIGDRHQWHHFFRSHHHL